MDAEAYLSYGRWVVDCPTGCGNAGSLRPDSTERTCGSWDDELQEWQSGCGTTYSVRWPENREEVNRVFDIQTKEWPVYDDDGEDTGETYIAYAGHYDGQDHLRSWKPGQEVSK